MIPMEDQPVMSPGGGFDIKSPLAQFAMKMMMQNMGPSAPPMSPLAPIQMHNPAQQLQGALMPQLPQINPIGKLYG